MSAVRAEVNGELVELPAGATVAEVVASLCADDRGVAVAVDREVVPRSCWKAVVIADGQSIEVVTAAAGG